MTGRLGSPPCNDQRMTAGCHNLGQCAHRCEHPFCFDARRPCERLQLLLKPVRDGPQRNRRQHIKSCSNQQSFDFPRYWVIPLLKPNAGCISEHAGLRCTANGLRCHLLRRSGCSLNQTCDSGQPGNNRYEGQATTLENATDLRGGSRSLARCLKGGGRMDRTQRPHRNSTWSSNRDPRRLLHQWIRSDPLLWSRRSAPGLAQARPEKGQPRPPDDRAAPAR
jgi:hypothetical protein